MPFSARLIASLFFFGLIPILHAEKKPAVFRAGAAVADITPPKFPVRVNGMFTERMAQQAVDRLYARCIALDDGATKFIMCVVDTCMMPRELIDEAKMIAAKQTGVSMERMMISATHTHSGASSMGCLGSREDPEYVAWLPAKLAESIVAAVRNLQPARVGWASVDDWEHTHNRRWIRRSDKVDTDPFGTANVIANMHPGYESANVIGPSGPVDPGLSVLAVQSLDGKPLALLANYSQHYFGSPLLSADYYGVFARHIAKLLGQESSEGPFVAMMSQGTSGDLMWMDYGAAKKNITLESYSEAVAKNALAAYKKITWHDHVPLGMVQKTLPLSYRVPDADRLAWAREKITALNGKLPTAKPDIYAQESLFLHEKQKTELVLQAIRIGDLSISALPNEVYAITGLKLKAQSPLGTHFNIELANGAEGYIPPPEQHVLGGYTTWPARTAGLEVQAEPQIVETLLAALEETSGKKRTTIKDEHGLYAQAVLNAKPLSYWRLNDIAGNKARNAVANAPDATITDGSALYLSGAGSGSGNGAEEQLKPSNFSGPHQINRAMHFVGGHLEADVSKLGDHSTLALWFWLGERSGASERSGSLITPDSGMALQVKQSADHTARLMLKIAKGELIGQNSLTASDWHFVALVQDGAQVKVFVDGSVKEELQTSTNSKSMGSMIRFADGLQGKLDEIVVFDRALTADELQKLHAASGLSAAVLKKAAPSKLNVDSQPLSPEESLKKLHVREGYKAELVAAEPLVLDPVAFDWDERGRLWVVEMADYPLGMDGKGKAGGRVRILEDTNGDGRFDKSTLFAEGLNFPNGILCWRDGCFVTAAPDIVFLKDSNGDGKVDEKNVVFSGFSTGNEQLRVNGLRWGMDGWVYCAAGGHHGGYNKETKITCKLSGEQVTLGGRDFRFRPDTGLLDPQSGPSQFGRCRDDWGHWFGVQNSKPLWHYILQDHYLRRNPHVIPPDPVRLLYPNNPPVYPASPPEKRFHSYDQAGRFTSACGIEFYRDALLFGDGKTHALTCEPFHNVVQHHIVEDDGVSFKSKPDTDGKTPDFFASEDRWCRAVMVRTGPDGALWVADMYRYMIEHPQWLPQNGKNELLPFYREGDDKGRVYRIYPNGKRPSPIKPLAEQTNAQLAALFGSTNGWIRDKAQMMLIWRKASDVTDALIAMANAGATPQARVQAAWTLQHLGIITPKLITHLLADASPRVREQALLIAEQHAADSSIVDAVVALANDADAKVRLQLACTLGEIKDARAGKALAALLQKSADDAYIAGAAMSSALPHLSTLAGMNISGSFQDIISTALGAQDDKTLGLLVQSMIGASQTASRSEGVSPSVPKNIASGRDALTTFRDFLAALKRNNTSLDQLAAKTKNTELRDQIQSTRKLFDSAAALYAKQNGNEQQKAMLVEISLLDRAHEATGVQQLHAMVDSLNAAEVGAAVTLISRHRITEAAGWLLAKAPSATPALRQSIIDALMATNESTLELLAAVKSGSIPVASFDGQRQARLLKHPNAKVKALATTLFTNAPSAHRAEVVAKFKPSLSLKGDAANGKAVFALACIACHKLDNAGTDLGPDLRSVVEHPPEKLLNSILDPSAIIEPGFMAYHCTLNSGELLYGVIATETSNSITMKMPGNITRSVLRSEISTLVGTGTSLMPDGLEAVLTPQTLADLIAYLKKVK